LSPAALANKDYAALEYDQSAIVAYSYFQIDDDAFPDMSLNFDTFQQHIETIKNENFTVVSLKDLKGYTKQKKQSAPSIAITFETGHKSILNKAIPLLLKEKLPFTIFISPAEIDQGQPYVIPWGELKKLKRNPLVTIGIHSATYKTMQAYKSRDDINHAVTSAITRYKEVFNHAPALYAYPYGDHDTALADTLKKNNIAFGFGLQSGVIHTASPQYHLPRFTMTDNFGSNQRFIDTAYNLPFPYFDMIPQDTVLPDAPTSLSFSVPSILSNSLNSLQCFHSGIGKISTDILGDERVHIVLPESTTSSGRLRVNCTINAGYDEIAERQRWRWHGILHRINIGAALRP
jgi:peptidoglycan/xylan/chitin deacetylase (PgdA/CDA1 family)